jgi:hypothetical protein
VTQIIPLSDSLANGSNCVTNILGPAVRELDSRIKNITGQTFGRTFVKHYIGDAYWLCVCLDCGCERRVQGTQLRGGHQLRCRICAGLHKSVHGHTRRVIAEGKKQTRTYQAWYSMHTRCRCPGSSAFEHYGGKGIAVSSRWESFSQFLDDMGEVPSGRSLDRKDGDEPYELGNCRWATPSMQRRNQKRNCFVTCFGVTMVARDAETLLGFCHGTLVNWIRKNPDFPSDVSQLYFVPWRNRRKLIWNSAGF